MVTAREFVPCSHVDPREGPFVPRSSFCLIPLSLSLLACIDTASLAVESTSKVLLRAQPALKMEPDYDLAALAIPASLKTVEGFHLAKPDNPILVGILAEGFCQYATGFIEDEWERAGVAGDLDGQAYQAKRATKSYFRCMNYGLRMVPKSWAKTVEGAPAPFIEAVNRTGWKHRDGMQWVGIGLAGAINYNKDDIEMVALHLDKAIAILQRVVALDDQKNLDDPARRVLPHLALGSAYTSRGKAVGGDPERGAAHFRRAIEITKGRFLLAKVYYARGYARITGDRQLFRKLLIEVLQTDPAIWPEQRLANEIAHRRARRYLKLEKEWF